jgi:murein L,D-transpeptidase YafK
LITKIDNLALKGIMSKILLFLLCIFSSFVYSNEIPSSPRVDKILQSIDKSLRQDLAEKKFQYGSQMFIRIFKTPAVLEVWLKQGSQFALFKRYPICTFSGDLGPKTKQGDYQAPEGFYSVQPASLNPYSQYHISFNLGYPNLFDRQNGRTGSALMVHGKCASIGCYAMGDNYIEEIYGLMVIAFKHGQKNVEVNIFPFALEDEYLDTMKDEKWYGFWKDLQPGYHYFNQHKKPPNIIVKNKRYQLD